MNRLADTARQKTIVERFLLVFLNIIGFSWTALPSANAVDFAREVRPIFFEYCIKSKK